MNEYKQALRTLPMGSPHRIMFLMLKDCRNRELQPFTLTRRLKCFHITLLAVIFSADRQPGRARRPLSCAIHGANRRTCFSSPFASRDPPTGRMPRSDAGCGCRASGGVFAFAAQESVPAVAPVADHAVHGPRKIAIAPTGRPHESPRLTRPVSECILTAVPRGRKR